MKRLVYLLFSVLVLQAVSCANANFVGDWERDTVIYAFSPIATMPGKIHIRGDYSYTSTESNFISNMASFSGVYSITDDSIFFGPDVFQRYKIIEITADHLSIERQWTPGFYDTTGTNYNVQATYKKL